MRIVACALLLFACLPARAQVTVEVLLEQKQFLRDESLPVKVRITNRSGQTLAFAENDHWLSFHIENIDGQPVIPRADPEVREAFQLESASVATRRVDLMPYFSLSRPGRYAVTAKVLIKDWGQEVASRPTKFDIIPGFKVWEQEFGVPAKDGAPDMRKFSLQQATYLKQLLLYVRLTDQADDRVYRVQPLGPLVSFSKPEAQVDKASNLHVLFQSGARSFYYVVVTPNGELLQRETHAYLGNSRPMLKADSQGGFVVSGGERRRSPTDLPVLAAESSDGPGAKP